MRSGEQLFRDLTYCTRCCLPETTEGIVFDEMGICQACQSSEQKIHIDWAARQRELEKLLAEYKAKAGNNYDCIVPISGGKDSTFQLHVLVKVYGMRPLAVTFSHNWFSEVGKANLENALEKFNVDHIMFTPNRALVNKLARESLGKIGDSCWHCHMGVGTFPLQIAVKFRIPLLVWGESIAEDSARASYFNPVRRFDREFFLAVSAKVPPNAMITHDITERDVQSFQLPSAEDCEALGLIGIHLGDYMFWDEERQVEFVRDVYGWRETNIEGTYKGYKSAECIMPGVHDYSKFLKRGFGRGTDHASVDVRAGLLTREEAFELAKEYDTRRPAVLDHYLSITGMTEEEFMETMKKHRHPRLRHLPIFGEEREDEE